VLEGKIKLKSYLSHNFIAIEILHTIFGRAVGVLGIFLGSTDVIDEPAVISRRTFGHKIFGEFTINFISKILIN
jgi:hypothetical protein